MLVASRIAPCAAAAAAAAATDWAHGIDGEDATRVADSGKKEVSEKQK